MTKCEESFIYSLSLWSALKTYIHQSDCFNVKNKKYCGPLLLAIYDEYRAWGPESGSYIGTVIHDVNYSNAAKEQLTLSGSEGSNHLIHLLMNFSKSLVVSRGSSLDLFFPYSVETSVERWIAESNSGQKLPAVVGTMG